VVNNKPVLFQAICITTGLSPGFGFVGHDKYS